MEIAALFIVLIVTAIVIRVVAGGMDGDRVGRYIRGQNGELIESHWSPFGRGWFGEKNDRIYEVRYRDQEGNIHEATVKTSLFSGVYFTEDKIVQTTKSAETNENDLELENARLRQRIAELEEEKDT